MITHHKRGADDALETRVMTEGALHLDPPGLIIQVKNVFGSAAAP